MFKLIAAIGKNRELGKDNDLCFHIKEDMKFFRETTMGHAVLMGSKTWDSLGCKPLPGRENYILSRTPLGDLPPHTHQITDMDAFVSAQQSSDKNEDIFIIGGASVYAQFLPYCRELYLTEIAASAPADVYFPDFDKSKYQRIILKEGADHGVNYAFVKYIKNN